MKNNIPPIMLSSKRWCCWRSVPNEKGELQKVPWRLDGVGRLTWSNPANLISFDEARAAFMAGADLPAHKGQHFAGCGYIIPEGSNSPRLVCLDLDKCISEDGALTHGAHIVAKKFGGYIEKSPSEKGLHIWVMATLPADFKNINTREGNEPLYIEGQKVETFIRKHFVTVTNNVYKEGVPEDRTAEVLELYAMKKAKPTEPAKKPLTEDEDKIRHYCQKALDLAANELICVKDGNRNNALNETAYSIGRYVGGGWLSRYEVESKLLKAAEIIELPQDESLATINSGIEAGIQEPKTPSLDVDLPKADEAKLCVTVGCNLITNTEDTLEALYRNNSPPRILQRGGDLVRVRAVGPDQYKIEELTDYAFRNEMGRAATFEKYAGEKAGYVECMPSMDLARSILALGEWDFPTLAGLITAPIVRPDGSLLLEPGYDASTRLFYVPDAALVIPDIELSEEAAKEAAKFFMDEVLKDFPFVDEASKANMLAAFLSPIVRPMIEGCSPMCLVDKPAPGTGASKLLELISIIATGKAMAAMSPPEDEDEWRKLITGVMRDGSPLINLDNIVSDLQAPTLARALSSSIWKDRTLGKPDATEYQQRACWYATGNNLTLNGDIPRRSYLCQLDAKMARPWERRPENFKHPDINKWVRENRGLLLSKLLTMAGSWAKAGRPAGDSPIIGGYDEWVEIMRGILKFSGVEGFLGNLSKLYDDVDIGNDEWADFFETWYEIHEDDPVSSAHLIMEMENIDSKLSIAVPSELAEKIKFKGPGNGKKVGIFLRKKVNVRYKNGLMLIQDEDKHTKSKKWKVVKPTDNTLA
jgi:hypothetical protein